MNAHHEPVKFTLPAEDEGGDWLLELDTAEPDRPADTPCAGDYEVGPRAMVVLRQPLDAQAVRAAAGAPARVHQAAGAAPPAARRRRHAAVLDPLGDRLGAGRDPGPGAASRLGAGGPGSRCCSSCRSTPRPDVDPSPYAAQLGVRARPRLPVARRVRGLHRRRRPRRAARRSCAARIDGRQQAPLVDWARGARAQARRHRAGLRALPARRVAHAVAARRAARRRSCAPTGLARRLRAVRGAARPASPRAGSTGRSRLRDRDPGAIAARPRASTPTRCCGRSGCSGSSICSGGARAARPAPRASS